MPLGKRRGYSDCIRGNRASRLTISAVRFDPLAALLLMAAAIRLPLAFWPNLIHSDEIFQYLEPAWRILGHEGIVCWELRYGIAVWLLPWVSIGPSHCCTRAWRMLGALAQPDCAGRWRTYRAGVGRRGRCSERRGAFRLADRERTAESAE